MSWQGFAHSIVRMASAVSFSLLAGAASQAASPVGQAPESNHRLIFVMDPLVASGLSTTEVGRRLGQYVADVNTIWGASTSRRFKFDPVTDLILAQPSSDTRCSPNVPRTPGEIMVCINKSGVGYSYGGSGATGGTYPQSGISYNMYWGTVHDPLQLSKTTMVPGLPVGTIMSTETDYLERHLFTIAHELGHAFTATDLYKINWRVDSTGVAPVTDMDVSRSTDRFWWTRWPMLDNLMNGLRYQVTGTGGVAASRVQVLESTRLHDVARVFVATDWDNNISMPLSYLPAPMPVTVTVLDPVTRAPLPGAQVSAWSVRGSDGSAALLGQGTSNATGNVAFNWGCGGAGCFSNVSDLVVLKANLGGRPPVSVWVTSYDLLKQKAILGQTSFTAEVPIPVADNSVPSVVVAAPTTGVAGRTITATATTSDNVGLFGVRFLIDGTTVCSLQAGAPLTCPIRLPLVGAQATITALAMDHAGNTSQSSTTVAISQPTDAAPPTISMSAPASASVGSVVTLSASAADASGVVKVEFFVNGALVCTDTTSPYACSWTPPAAGYANVEARATDTAGNVASAGAGVRVAAAVDTVKPVVSFASAPPFAVVGKPSTFAVNATDNVGVVRVEFAIYGGATVCIDTAAPYTCTWTPTTVSPAVTMLVSAFDAAGNKSTLAWGLTVRPDESVPPVVTVTGPASAKVGVPTVVTATVTDASQILSVTFDVGNTRICKVTAAPYQCNWTPTAAGLVSLSARATDAAMNVGAASRAVTVSP